MRNAYVSRVVLRIYVSVWSFRLVFFAISQKCFVSWSLGLFKCVCKGRDLSCRVFFYQVSQSHRLDLMYSALI